jgi:hypothetical protein
MSEITKETFLKAEDSKNRDAMLFDMLQGISDKCNMATKLKKRVEKCENHMSYLKGVGVTISLVFSGILAWLFKH